jgi:phosphoglycerate kinase
LAHDVLKARGLEVGKSMISDVSLVDSPFLWDEKLLVPIDVVVESADGVAVKSADAVLPDDIIYDLGEETLMMLKSYIENAKTILWNGPFGNYEKDFEEGTEAVARLVADSDGFSVIGGGDTVAAVNNLGLSDKFEFISIGGGSMLTFLEKGSTPALAVLER